MAVALLGTLGGARASSATGAGAAETRAAEATAMKMDVFMVGKLEKLEIEVCGYV